MCKWRCSDGAHRHTWKKVYVSPTNVCGRVTVVVVRPLRWSSPLIPRGTRVIAPVVVAWLPSPDMSIHLLAVAL